MADELLLLDGGENLRHDESETKMWDPDTLIVVLANAAYDASIQTSKQMVARELAKRHAVLYVEPAPLTVEPLVKRGTASLYFRFAKGIRRAGAGQPMLLSPPPLRQPLDTRLPAIDRVNQEMTGRFVRRHVERLGHRKLILISFIYNFDRIAAILQPELTAYYCIDLWPNIRIPYSSPAAIAAIERRGVDAADLVLVTSEALQERHGANHPDVVYAPHGVSDNFLRRARNATPPPELAGIPRPRLGFLGTLSHWVDFELLQAVARSRPDWNLCLVGPPGPHVDTDPLQRVPNIHLLGGVPHERTPLYLSGFDVCLIPFLVNQLTRASQPLKTYEYLAVGKPIVATPLPELSGLAPPIRMAATPSEFVDACAGALIEWDDDDRAESRRLAQSWSSRVATIESILRERLNRSQRRRTCDSTVDSSLTLRADST